MGAKKAGPASNKHTFTQMHLPPVVNEPESGLPVLSEKCPGCKWLTNTVHIHKMYQKLPRLLHEQAAVAGRNPAKTMFLVEIFDIEM